MRTESMQPCNRICVYLMKWANSLVEYVVALKQVIPLKHKIELLREEITEQKKLIRLISVEINHKKEKLSKNADMLSNRNNKILELQKTLLGLRQNASNCRKIMNWLIPQSKKWHIDLTKLST